MKEIIKKIIERNYSKGNNRKIDYIVIHYTAGSTSKKGTALNCANWFNSLNCHASAHYIVDDELMVQAVEDEDIAWHCGDGSIHPECRNHNSIGIEICSTHDHWTAQTPPSDSGWYFTDAVKKNAIELTKYLMNKYGIDKFHVIRHYDVSGKDCPAPWVDGNKEGLDGWLWFINQISKDDKFQKIEDCPEWSQEAIQFFVSKEYLKGNEKGLDLTEEMVRFLVVLYRTIKGELK